MEPTPMGAFPCGDWDPLSLLFTNEDLDLTHKANQMYDEMSFEIPADYISATFGGYPADQTMPGIRGSFLNPTQSPNCSSLAGSSQEGSFGSGLSNSFSEYYTELPMLMEERYSGDSFVPDFMGILAGEGFCQSDDDNNNNPGSDVGAEQEASVPAAKRLQPERKCTKSKPSTGEEDIAGTDVIQNPKKRKPRAPEDVSKADLCRSKNYINLAHRFLCKMRANFGECFLTRVSEMHLQKGKKNVLPKKKKKKLTVARDDGEDGNTIARQEGQSLSTCSSEEGSVSEELRNGESAKNSNETSALNSDGKTARASRGAATDPQSLYARV